MDSSVGTATGYGLDGPGSIPGSTRFSLLLGVQTDSGAHPVCYAMRTEGFSPGVRWQGGEAVHSPPSSTEVKKFGAIPPLPHIPSWHSAEIIKHRDNFALCVWTCN
jgi:hypothetical protein